MDVEESNILCQILGLHRDDSLFDSRSNNCTTCENSERNVATGENQGVNPRAPAGGPTVGMNFPSLEAMLYFYQEHARQNGFRITKYSCKKHPNESGVIYARRLSFHRARNRGKDQNSNNGCKAGIFATLCTDRTSWEVQSVTVEHNHDLEPRFTSLMPSRMKLSPAPIRRDLVAVSTAGVSPSRSFRAMEIMNGGAENMGCLPSDSRKGVDQDRRLKLNRGDAEVLNQFFQRMRAKDNKFIYEMDLDNEGRLRNVMWIHSQAVLAYQQFHDVVYFDSSYKVNQETMPFATVVGVNHHNQSIILGAGLLSSEDITSYRWLFGSWVKCMGGIKPRAIVTDQCESIGAAIREEFPTTTHRLSLWRMLSKVRSEFKGVREKDAVIQQFESIIYRSMSVVEFERRWDQFIRDPRLQDRRWLEKIYSTRSQWVPVYLKDTFWAGIRSTKRSKSIHPFLDQFINRKADLQTFAKQYEVAIKSKLEKELKEEESSKESRLISLTGSPWERQLRACLTRNIYDLHRKKIQESVSCIYVGSDAQDEVEIFSVSDTGMGLNHAGTDYNMTVEYKRDGQHLDCSCKMFNTDGIICRHMILLLQHYGEQRLNDRYILRRWRGDISRPHLWAYVSAAYPQMSDEFQRLQGLKGIFYQCAERAIRSDLLTDKLKLDLMANFYKPNNDDPIPDDIHDVEDHRSDAPILDANFLRIEGRPCLVRVRDKWNKRRRANGSRVGRGGSRGGASGAGRGSGGVDASDGNCGVDAGRGNGAVDATTGSGRRGGTGGSRGACIAGHATCGVDASNGNGGVDASRGDGAVDATSGGGNSGVDARR